MENTGDKRDTRCGRNNNQMDRNRPNEKVKNISCDIDMNIMNIFGNQKENSELKKENWLNRKKRMDSNATKQEKNYFGYKNKSKDNISNSINNSFFPEIQGHKEKLNYNHDNITKNLNDLLNASSKEKLNYYNQSRQEDIWSHGKHQKKLLDTGRHKTESYSCSKQEDGWIDDESKKNLINIDKKEKEILYWTRVENLSEQKIYEVLNQIEIYRKSSGTNNQTKLHLMLKNLAEQRELNEIQVNMILIMIKKFDDNIKSCVLQTLAENQKQSLKEYQIDAILQMSKKINTGQKGYMLKKLANNQILNIAQINAILIIIENFPDNIRNYILQALAENQNLNECHIDVILEMTEEFDAGQRSYILEKLANNQILNIIQVNAILIIIENFGDNMKSYVLQALAKKRSLEEYQIDVILKMSNAVNAKQRSYTLENLAEKQSLNEYQINVILEMLPDIDVKSQYHTLERLLKNQRLSKTQLNVILGILENIDLELRVDLLKFIIQSEKIRKEQFDFVAIWQMLKKSETECVIPMLLRSRPLTPNQIKAILIMIVILLKKHKEDAQKEISNILKELVNKDKTEKLTDEQFEIILGTWTKHRTKQMYSALQKLVNGEEVPQDEFKDILKTVNKLNSKQVGNILKGLVSGQALSESLITIILSVASEFDQTTRVYFLTTLVDTQSLTSKQIKTIVELMKNVLDEKSKNDVLQCLIDEQIDTILESTKKLGKQAQTRIILLLVSYGDQLSKKQIDTILGLTKNLDKKPKNDVILALAKGQKLSEKQIDMILILAESLAGEKIHCVIKCLIDKCDSLSQPQLNTILKLARKCELDKKLENYVLQRLHLKEKDDLGQEQMNKIFAIQNSSNREITNDKSNNVQNSTQNKTKKKEQIPETPQTIKLFNNKMPLLNDLLNLSDTESNKLELQNSTFSSQSEEKSSESKFKDKNNLTFSNNKTRDISIKSISDRIKKTSGRGNDNVPRSPGKHGDVHQDNNIF